MNLELPDVQAGFRKGRGTRDQIANIRWIMEKAREFQKNIYICFIDYAKAFDCVDHNKLWEIMKEMRIPDHLICLLINLYAGQEATPDLPLEKFVCRSGSNRHDSVTFLSLFTFMHWRRKWQATPVLLPGGSQRQESLVGCHLWGRTESDTTEVI